MRALQRAAETIREGPAPEANERAVLVPPSQAASLLLAPGVAREPQACRAELDKPALRERAVKPTMEEPTPEEPRARALELAPRVR
jgi:hypothetical protein